MNIEPDDRVIGRPGRVLVQIHEVHPDGDIDAHVYDFDEGTDAALIKSGYYGGYWIKHYTPLRKEGVFIFEGVRIIEQITEAPDLLDSERHDLWVYAGVREATDDEIDCCCLSEWHLTCGRMPHPGEKVDATIRCGPAIFVETVQHIDAGGYWCWAQPDQGTLYEEREVIAWRPLKEPTPYDGPAEYLSLPEVDDA